MTFEPIAIVGRGCVLPGAPDPDTFWENITAGRTDLGEGRTPGADLPPPGSAEEREVAALDPVVRWSLHAARAALHEAGGGHDVGRAGLITGNLSFPTAGLLRVAESVWRDTAPAQPRDRFSSGLPAHLVARALGLGRGAFALDAACASGLYAVAMACDRLHDHRAELMLAGGVQCADEPIIREGFRALGALSPSGRSRPFDRDGDGLVPAWGAAFVALMRLDDAVRQQRPVLGVIRGIGLSNDGRTGGLLSPAREGQVRAMESAYRAAGLAPTDISLVECHAAGTPVGDAVEAASLTEVFADCADVPVGSVKSNVGHLLTAAGTAGLLKVLGAMRAGIRPATVGLQEPVEALTGGPLRAVRRAEEWPGPRRAAVSAFGFGGNNAHVIVEEHAPAPRGGRVPCGNGGERPRRPAAAARDDVVVCAVAVRAGDGRTTADFTDALLHGRARATRRESVDVPLDGLCFPPHDLHRAHAQQSLALEVALEVAAGASLPRERTMVLVGMGCDPEVARHSARLRAPAGQEGAFAPPLEAAHVLGAMPNMVANRISAQLDLGGPGFTVSAEEASGTVALREGARALRAGEADAVLVGAVDLSAEPVHEAAARALGLATPAGDAAVAVLVKRRRDAERDGDAVIAALDDPDADDPLDDADDEDAPRPDLVIGTGGDFDPVSSFGSAHAAQGLLAVAVAALSLRHRARPRPGKPAVPDLGEPSAEAVVHPLAAPRGRLRLRGDTPAAWVGSPPLVPRVFSGRDRREALAALDAGRESTDGPARLVVLASEGADPAAPGATPSAARAWLTGQGPRPTGVAFRERPLGGETAFVYTNGSAAYPGMGRDLPLAFPDIADHLRTRCGPLPGTVGWAYGQDPDPPRALERIWGAAYVSLLHTHITRDLAKVTPDAVLGYSSGETAALVATGVWDDVPEMVASARRSPVFRHALVGEMTAVRRVWARLGVEGTHWTNLVVAAPRERVSSAMDGEPAVYLLAVTDPGSCVIGGESSACERVVDRLQPCEAIPLDYDIAVHAPVVDEVREEWHRLHHRTSTPDPEGPRFYSGATGAPYVPTSDAVATALTAQATGTIDFVRLVERAWDDGVRVFVEHGPGTLCTGWIRRILADRDHLAVALDGSSEDGLTRMALAGAELLAAGVPIDTGAYFGRLRDARPPRAAGTRRLSLPAHPPPVRPAQPDNAPPAVQEDDVGPPDVPVEGGPTVGEAMEPAPPLPVPEAQPAPPAPGPGTWSDGPPAPTVPPAAPAGGTDTSGTPDPSSAAPTPHTVVAGQLHRLTATHQEYLATQAQAHERFLALRGRLEHLSPAPRPDNAHADAPETPHPAPPEPPTPARPTDADPRPVAAEPVFDRHQLERLATERISSFFGPAFAAQDAHPRQTRLPEPPLLLVDRVTGIDAVPASMGTGTISTETDVRSDGWYLDAAGRMSAGPMVEAGQADLLLISWLGVDLLNRGERVYRLLGCDLTFHGGLAVPGERLCYDIRIDGHGAHDGARLFFFGYDCHAGGELRLSVREGQAGFFTDAELTATDGVIWDPRQHRPPEDGPADPPRARPDRRGFQAARVRAFAERRPADCFGEGWERTRCHVRSPSIGSGRMLLLGTVPDFRPDGGPWGRGYLRADTPIAPDAWFFDGHFTNDPCMPGTLMLEGCLQAMAFHLAALGHTIDRDGWRFEPVPERTSRLRCRGQVTPDSRRLTYEVFVVEVRSGPEPTLIADVLCTVDGVKAFHAAGLGVRLVPDWPLEHWSATGPPAVQRTGEPVALSTLGGLVGHEPSPAGADGVPGDYGALLASAWGRPSEAFGPMYAPFDDGRPVPRLPGPPYLFMSRVTDVRGPAGGMRVGSRVEAEYDVPDEAWFFEQGGDATMPFCALIEVALQPCGWLGSYIGSVVALGGEVLFRNLGASATLLREVSPDTRVVTTRAEVRRVMHENNMIIETFDVHCLADGEHLLELTAEFGFFPPESFHDQTGLPPTGDEVDHRPAPRERAVDLTTHPGMPGPMLRVLDRVTGVSDEGDRVRLWAEKDVDAGEWFFRAHFFQDPVQPGSLGVEALCQLLRFYLLDRGVAPNTDDTRFEPVMTGQEVVWTFRGQVVPTTRRITVEMEVVETGECHAVADAWLWADDVRIYRVQGVGMRVVPARHPAEGHDGAAEGVRAPDVPRGPGHPVDHVVDPAHDAWLLDHRPTWTVPTMPLMSMADLLAGAAGQPVTGLRDVRVRRWLPLREPTRLRTRVDGAGRAELWVRASATGTAPPRFEPVANGTLRYHPPPRPTPLAPLQDAERIDAPYESGALFHGPSLRYLVDLRVGAAGASGTLDAAAGGVPRGHLHQGLLDAALHVLPNDRLWTWHPDIPHGAVAYPHRIASLDLFAPLPDRGTVGVQARFVGFDDGDPARPVVELQVVADGAVLAAVRLVEVLLPAGPLGAAGRAQRRSFMRERRYADGLGLSSSDGDTTVLRRGDAERVDWLQGTVAELYGLPPDARAGERTLEIAVRDHVARLARVHPSTVVVAPDLGAAHPAGHPADRYHVAAELRGDDAFVRDR